MDNISSSFGMDSIFKNLNTVRTLNNNMPTVREETNTLLDKGDKLLNKGNNLLNNTNSVVSGKKDAILMFIGKLTEIIDGFLSYKEIFTSFLSTQIPILETYTKRVLKEELNDVICDTNPEIPSNFLYTGNGINYSASYIDVFGTYNYNPESNTGKLLYEDTILDPNTQDFDNFMYQVIQVGINTPGSSMSWGASTIGRDILTFTYTFQDISTPNGNNMINVKASQGYSDPASGFTYVDLINDYLDSLTIFNEVQLTNTTLNDVLSPQTDINFNYKTLPLSILQKKMEAQFLLTKIINVEKKDLEVIDDSYYTLNDVELAYTSELANNAHQHIMKFNSCSGHTTSVDSNILTGLTESLISATTIPQFHENLSTGVDNITSDIISNSNINPQNGFALQLNFFERIIDSLYKSVSGTIITPKLLTTFTIHDSIINNRQPSNDITTFLSDHKTLVWTIAKMLITPLITFIIGKLIKVISDWISQKKSDDIKEGLILNITSLLSLTGYSNISKIFEIFRDKI